MGLQSLVRWFLPREDHFYNFLERQATAAHEGARALATFDDESSSAADVAKSVQAVEHQGDAIVHDSDDVKRWFYPALAARVRPDSKEQQDAFVKHLDTPGRVVIEIRPTQRIGFDAENMFKDSPAGPSRTEV